MGTRVAFLGVKRPGHEADHSPPTSAKVKNAGAIPPLSQYAFKVWRSVKSTGTTLPLPYLTLPYLTLTLLFRLSGQRQPGSVNYLYKLMTVFRE